MANTIDIATLKSNNSKPAGATVDGNSPRDFGNGLKEFDPVANGFKPEEVPQSKPDKDKALEAFDKQMEARAEEVKNYNELLEQYGGEITEEQLREELGQSSVTKMLHDGTGDKFEDNTENQAIEGIIPDEKRDQLKEKVDQQTMSELEELERELENDMNVEEKVEATEKIVQSVTTERTPVDTITEKQDTSSVAENTAAGKTIPVGHIKETSVDSDGISEEDKDLAALEDDSTPPVDDFEAKLKKELEKKMKPVSKKFDLSTAVVSAQPITVNNVMGSIVPLDKKVFTWALMRSKRPITMKGFTATELNVLSTSMRSESRSRDIFKSIWDHIMGVGKGKDFDTWTKCTSYFDVDHIWFSIYGACFQDANYLPFNCPKCHNLTVTTDTPLLNMCKFAKPEYKDEMQRIIKLPAEPTMGNIFAEYRVQVSDSIVIGFREPSIYDAVIAPNMYDSEFRSKYEDIIGLCAYISNIYYVGVVNNQVTLRPIAVKQFINNEVKTMKARVIQYAKIIRSLSSDQYNIIMGHINAMGEEETITYGLPATSCDHCKAEIPEERDAAADLVFMRHRLAILGA